MIEQIKAYDLLIEQLNKSIRNFKAHPKILDKEEHKYLYPVFEKVMYIAICSSDLLVSLKYLDLSNALKNGLLPKNNSRNPAHIETNYFSRSVAHISYELINHQQKIIGPDVVKTIKNEIGENLLIEFKTCSKELKDITKKYHTKLKYIRNNLFGHRNANGSEMAYAMLEIDAVEIYKIGNQILKVYMKIIAKYTDLLGKI